MYHYALHMRWSSSIYFALMLVVVLSFFVHLFFFNIVKWILKIYAILYM